MPTGSAPHSLMRGLAVSGVGFWLAWVGHAVAGGPGPILSPVVLLLAAAGTGVIITLSRRTWTLSRLVPVLLGVQVAAHLAAIVDMSAGPLLSAPGHHHVTLAGHVHVVHPPLSMAMLVAHLVMTAVSAVLLVRIDDAVALCVALLRRLAARWTTVGVLVPSLLIPGRVVEGSTESWITAGPVTRRGPPMAVAG